MSYCIKANTAFDGGAKTLNFYPATIKGAIIV